MSTSLVLPGEHDQVTLYLIPQPVFDAASDEQGEASARGSRCEKSGDASAPARLVSCVTQSTSTLSSTMVMLALCCLRESARRQNREWA